MTSSLWQSEGLGRPLFLSAGAWHPLTLAARLLGISSAASTVTYAIALLIFGAVTSLLAIRYYAATPSRARWSLAAITLTLALLGTSSFTLIPLIMLIAIGIALMERRRLGGWSFVGPTAAASEPLADQPAGRRRSLLLDIIAAIITAALFAAPWWLPARTIGHERANATTFDSKRLARLRPFTISHTAPPHFFFPRTILVRDDVETARRLTDLGELATVDHIPEKISKLSGGTLPHPSGGALLSGAGGGVIVRRAAGDFAVDVKSNGWNLLVSNVPWWDGWRVYRNGERLPPLIANTAFVATFVPPGNATIEFRYRPDSLAKGLRCAAAGLLLFIITLVWPWPAALAPRAARFAQALRDKTNSVSLPHLPHMPRLPRLHVRVPPQTGRVVVIILLVAYAAMLIGHRVEVAGGADSSGYLNQSRQWLTGKLRAPIPLATTLGLPPEIEHSVIPLGYSRGPDHTMVPTYPPGLPLQMAFMRVIGGERGPFFLAPLLAIAGALLLFQLARDLGFTFGWAACTAAIYALCPIIIFHGIQPMSDVVAGAWAIAAMLCAFRGANNPRFALLAGICLGMGVLIRPTQILLFPAVVAAIGFNRRSLAALVGGGAPFALVQMAFAQHLYGSPFSTGYGSVLASMRWSYFIPRFTHYCYWLAAILSPIVFPIGLAGLTRRDVNPRMRAVLALWFVPFFLFYCFYGPYETWWYTRFLVPAIPSLILAAMLLLRAITGTSRARLTAVSIVIAGIFALQIQIGRHFDILTFGDGEGVYPEAAQLVKKYVPKDAVVLAMQQSGSLYYYAGRLSLRYDEINAPLFAQIRTHGGHFYALVADWEFAELKENTTTSGWAERAHVRDCYLLELK